MFSVITLNVGCVNFGKSPHERVPHDVMSLSQGPEAIHVDSFDYLYRRTNFKPFSLERFWKNDDFSIFLNLSFS